MLGAMPHRNRVDPWGDLHAVDERGLLTGNRGCLVNADGDVVRHHAGALWICCLIEFRGRRVPVAASGRWTPIFFLDDAVALAAGHRPCNYCRRDAYRSYRDAVTRAAGVDRPLLASELNARLNGERHRRGRGLDRAADRRLWTEHVDRLPAYTVLLDEADAPRLLTADALLRFGFGGWQHPVSRPSTGMVRVLTPPTSVAALGNGFEPLLHPTAFDT